MRVRVGVVSCMLCLGFLCDREHANKKIKTHKNIDGDIYVYDLDLLGNTDSFGELEYDAYLACCFVMYFFYN